ncbi:LytTR family DNA-binding domain-containing protein [Gluconacetobacter sacchari]|uniref:LytTR family DNA-binding domain-containing protein n=1 Tax=Gluconacetobacter sacchari TaxID=92759 RepID=UPI0039B3C244
MRDERDVPMRWLRRYRTWGYRVRGGSGARVNGLPPFHACLLTLGLASIPAVPLCMLVGDGTFGTIRDFTGFYVDALGLGVILSVIRHGLWRERPVQGEVVSAGPAPGMPYRDFLRRHAPKLAGATLLALEAEDQYLRIHTDQGQVLTLLRLRDAIGSLGVGAGLQVHRSFWVAADAAPRAVRQGQSWRLDLPSGLGIPVSRVRVAACRAAGWL